MSVQKFKGLLGRLPASSGGRLRACKRPHEQQHQAAWHMLGQPLPRRCRLLACTAAGSTRQPKLWAPAAACRTQLQGRSHVARELPAACSARAAVRRRHTTRLLVATAPSCWQHRHGITAAQQGTTVCTLLISSQAPSMHTENRCAAWHWQHAHHSFQPIQHAQSAM